MAGHTGRVAAAGRMCGWKRRYVLRTADGWLINVCSPGDPSLSESGNRIVGSNGHLTAFLIQGVITGS